MTTAYNRQSPAGVVRMFGGNPDDAVSFNQWSTTTQMVAESLTATTSRAMPGPRKNGHFSFHTIVGAGTTPNGALTVWYSNLPNPDETNDAHWVQDATIGSISCNAAANFFNNVGNVDAAWVRFKMTYTSGTISLIVFATCEGVTHGGAQ